MSDNFNIYEAIAKVHNERYPNGTQVTISDVREELHKLLAAYGEFKKKKIEQPENSQGRRTYRCSFCSKPQNQVQRLIAGPGAVYICNECVDLCQEILEEEGISQGS